MRLAYFLDIKKLNKDNPKGWKCLESCLLEISRGPLSPLTVLSAAAHSMGFWTVRKCGEVPVFTPVASLEMFTACQALPFLE